MTATYGQVRDILTVAVEFHRRPKDFYGRLGEQAKLKVNASSLKGS